jgi:anti-sigma factor ChrR (cupin superfamily)
VTLNGAGEMEESRIHPSREDLAAFASGRTVTDEERLHEHLVICSECRDVVSAEFLGRRNLSMSLRHRVGGVY